MPAARFRFALECPHGGCSAKTRDRSAGKLRGASAASSSFMIMYGLTGLIIHRMVKQLWPQLKHESQSSRFRDEYSNNLGCSWKILEARDVNLLHPLQAAPRILPHGSKS